jgi:hypothetical protein
LGGGEARAKVRMSVSVSVEETRRGTAESGGFERWLKQREVRGLYRRLRKQRPVRAATRAKPQKGPPVPDAATPKGKLH